MATLSSAARKRLPSSAFALPGRRYPIEDRAHAANAKSRVSQYGTPAEKAAVRSKVAKKFPGLGKKRNLRTHLTAMRKAGAFRKAAC